MGSVLRLVLFSGVLLGSSALVGCARDPVIPEQDIPNIPPSPRAAGTDVTGQKTGGDGSGGMPLAPPGE